MPKAFEQKHSDMDKRLKYMEELKNNLDEFRNEQKKSIMERTKVKSDIFPKYDESYGQLNGWTNMRFI